MIIAGARLGPDDVATLTGTLRKGGMSECADRLESSSEGGSHLFTISTEERLGFINALDDDCPDELKQLYASLKDTLITEAPDAPAAGTLSTDDPASARGGTTTL